MPFRTTVLKRAAFDPVFLDHTILRKTHDTEPEEARDTRRALVERAISEDALVVGSHFRLPGIGRLVKIAEDRFRRSPATA